MGKRCVYCGTEVASESVIDFCEKCGVKTFGVKMFKTIIDSMQQARTRGDLDQGNIK